MSRWRRQQRKRARWARKDAEFWAWFVAGLEKLERDTRVMLMTFKAQRLRAEADRLEKSAWR